MRLLDGLTWLGRHGGALIAIGVFVGLLPPPLASLLRPLLVPAILAPFLIAWLGRRGALTFGLCSGSGNLGLLLAALADRASFELLVFVATAQLPICTLPVIQRRLYHRWLTRSAAPRDAP